MFSKIFSRPLKLRIEEADLTFSSLVDFEFALACRTEVPWKRLVESLKLSDEDLKREAEGIKQVEKRFVDVLSKTMEDETTIGQHFRSMDLKLFSQDHQWRTIIAALNAQDPEYDEFKRRALIKYMQYLTSRQEVVQSIYSDRQSGGTGESSKESAIEHDLKETVIFDLNRPEASVPPKKGGNLVRMPKGDAIQVPLLAENEISVLLSKHRFKLVPGEQCYFVDESGAEYLLHNGKNFVGRDVENDVVVNAAYRDVSRKHMIIEIKPDQVAFLTDLSSHGSFVSDEYLDHTVGG